jgi:hypothetical protein
VQHWQKRASGTTSTVRIVTCAAKHYLLVALASYLSAIYCMYVCSKTPVEPQVEAIVQVVCCISP